jgi:hypothetical protein
MSQTFTTPLAHARPRPGSRTGALRGMLRLALLAFGILLIAVGLVGAVLPFHLGLPVLVIGLAVVLRSSIGAKREFVRWQRRHPNWVFPLRRLMRREPEVVHVMWHSMLRTERFLPRKLRVLVRLRRGLRRRPD